MGQLGNGLGAARDLRGKEWGFGIKERRWGVVEKAGEGQCSQTPGKVGLPRPGGRTNRSQLELGWWVGPESEASPGGRADPMRQTKDSRVRGCTGVRGEG